MNSLSTTPATARRSDSEGGADPDTGLDTALGCDNSDETTYAVVDFETTGLSPHQGDRAIEIGISLFRGGREVDTFGSLINPGMRIPAFITILTEGVNWDWEIDKQSVVLHEVRVHWKDAGQLLKSECIKMTFVRTKDVWQIHWMRADLKWHSYEPDSVVSSFDDCLAVLKSDEYGCFFG